MPAVDAHFRPLYGGGDFRTVAVVDSGSTYTFVPHGIPVTHKWTRKGVPLTTVSPIGGRKLRVRRYLVNVDIGSGSWAIPVCEFPKGSKLNCSLIGQDLLLFMKAILDGPNRRLLLESP